ncbi:MAG: T9SS type A sorting domain-containing protein [bacterium]|nr:T9SS type A sorting domain-containing protein [bacterium]
MLKSFPKIGATIFIITVLLSLKAQTVPRNVSGWPINTGPVHYASVAVGDLLNADGKEIVLCTFDGWLYVIESSGRVTDRYSITSASDSEAKEVFTPALADVDGDGSLNIVHASRSGRLSVYDNCGASIAGWPIDLSGRSLSSPVIQDLTQFPGLEIIVAAESGDGAFIYGFHNDGSAINGWPVSVPGEPNVSVGDIDNDGTADVLITTGKEIYAFDYRGEAIPGWPQSPGSDISAPAVIADLDLDDRTEILIGTTDGNAYALSGDGQVRPGWPAKIGNRPITTPAAIANIDGVTGLEAIFVAGNAHIGDSILAVVGEGGRTLRGYPKKLSYSVAAAPLAFDVEGDGLPEVFLVACNGSALAFDSDGEYSTGYPLNLSRGKITATPSAADIDGDGDTDVIIATEDGYLLAIDLLTPYERSAAPWPTYQGDHWRGGKFHKPAGKGIELQAETRGGNVEIKWSAKPSSDRDYWEILRAERTGAGLGKFVALKEIEQALHEDYKFSDKDVAESTIYYYKIKEKLVNGGVNTFGPKIIKTQTSPKKAAGTTELIKSFPNPFTSETTITFSIAEDDAGLIYLTIYDLSGKIIRELKREQMNDGTYSVSWNGYDGNGNQLPPGVYICQLRPETSGKVSAKSLVLVR